jgi:hypothetical protein
LDEKKINNCFNILSFNDFTNKTSSPSNKHVSVEREREREMEIERFEREQS